MSFSDAARSSVENNRAKKKSRKERFKFKKMLPKSAENHGSMSDFLKAKHEFRAKVRKDKLKHWTRFTVILLVAALVIIILVLAK